MDSMLDLVMSVVGKIQKMYRDCPFHVIRPGWIGLRELSSREINPAEKYIYKIERKRKEREVKTTKKRKKRKADGKFGAEYRRWEIIEEILHGTN